MAETHLGYSPQEHMEAFWQKALLAPEGPTTDVLHAKWRSLQTQEEQLHFLYGAHHLGLAQLWWNKVAPTLDASPHTLQLLIFLLSLEQPLEQKNSTPWKELNLRFAHPWLNWSLALLGSSPDLQDPLEIVQTHGRKNLEKKRQELLRQLELSRNLGLAQQEAEFLKRLQRVFPKNKELQMAQQTLKERKAHEILRKLKEALHGAPTDKISAPPHKPERSPEEVLWLDHIQSQIEKKGSLNVADWMLFSYILIFMEDYERALKLLNKTAGHIEVDFLRIDLLLNLGSYLEALAVIDSVEPSCSHSDELLASLQLSRAKSLHGLGDEEAAVEILRALVFIKPDFRDSEILLRRWEEELSL